MIYKKTKREIESQKKKKKIVEEAINLFVKYGYDRITVADISEATGSSVGSIYNFFGNKAGIICDSSKDIYRAAAEHMMNDKDRIEDPKKVLLSYYQNVSDGMEEYGYELAKVAMQTCSEEYRNGEDFAYREISLQAIIDLFDEIKKNGKWRSEESIEAVAEQIHMEYMGIVCTWTYFPIHKTLREAIDANLTVLINKFDF